jgi:hypothetical protein
LASEHGRNVFSVYTGFWKFLSAWVIGGMRQLVVLVDIVKDVEKRSVAIPGRATTSKRGRK